MTEAGGRSRTLCGFLAETRLGFVACQLWDDHALYHGADIAIGDGYAWVQYGPPKPSDDASETWCGRSPDYRCMYLDESENTPCGLHARMSADASSQTSRRSDSEAST